LGAPSRGPVESRSPPRVAGAAAPSPEPAVQSQGTRSPPARRSRSSQLEAVQRRLRVPEPAAGAAPPLQRAKQQHARAGGVPWATLSAAKRQAKVAEEIARGGDRP
jgi:hypothetical protein